MAEQKLYFEDVSEGDEAPVVTHELTRTDLVEYAGASGDFNPRHHDDVKAQQAGLPGDFAHALFSTGFLASVHTDSVPVDSHTKHKARFAKQTWPHKTS